MAVALDVVLPPWGPASGWACQSRHRLPDIAQRAMAAPEGQTVMVLLAADSLPEALTSRSAVTRANTRLVSASPSARRAMALGSIRPWGEGRKQRG